MSEPMERCDNCSQLFPESKINSHFSYCRRNIKKCTECSMMVDINFKEEHEQEFHTTQSCQYCKREFKGQELSSHQGGCKAKPKYCEFCQLNINVSQFDKHVISCGSRTNTCPKCEKHIMLKDFVVHQVQCKGKVIETPIQPAMDAFRKKQREQKDNSNRINDQRYRPQVQPTTNIPSTSYTHKIPSSKQIREEPRRVQQNIYNPRQVQPTTTNQRTYERSDRNIGGISTKNSYGVQQIKPAPKKQQPKLNPYNRPQDDPRSYPIKKQQKKEQALYRQQREYLKREAQKQKERQQKRAQEPRQLPQTNVPSFSEADYLNFDLSGEDLEMQRILMEQMQNKTKKTQKIKAPNGYEDLGIDHMSQSFYRDLQQQQQIMNNVKKQVPRRR